MKLHLITFLLISAYSLRLLGQEQEITMPFEILPTDTVIKNSLYNELIIIDSRINKRNCGVVQKGIMNNKAIVTTEPSLEIQLDNYGKQVIDKTAKEGTLVFQIRKFLITEYTKFASEHGYCDLKANIYSKMNSEYQLIGTIDTLVSLQAGDVTKKIFKEGSHLLTNTINYYLTHFRSPISDKTVSINAIEKIDSLEKRSIPVYNTDVYPDGIYYTYDDFKNLVPNAPVEITYTKRFEIKAVKTPNEDGEFEKIKSDSIFACVFEGRPYIGTGYGFYPINKSQDQLYFVGTVKPLTTDKGMTGASIALGLIGVIIASQSAEPGIHYYIIIDHNNGDFVPIKKMPVEKMY